MATQFFKRYIQLESSAGIFLILVTSLALIVDNSPLRFFYHAFFNYHLTLHLGVINLSKSVLLWINEGLMTIFFLLVGLEIKREMVKGSLGNAVPATSENTDRSGPLAVSSTLVPSRYSPMPTIPLMLASTGPRRAARSLRA